MRGDIGDKKMDGQTETNNAAGVPKRKPNSKQMLLVFTGLCCFSQMKEKNMKKGGEQCGLIFFKKMWC